MEQSKLEQYRAEVLTELKSNILPFWINNVIDKENGGYYGKVANDLKIDKEADKGCILNSRILWTYSLAYRIFKDEAYLEAATHAYNFMLEHFWDKEYSGLYWMVDYKGNVVEGKKQIYNIAFGIYALSEYYRATGIEESLDRAVELYRLIEKYSRDKVHRGYIEALSREWNELEDMRLSLKDLNSKKSMNTHLHILEAYTNLFRVWSSEELKESLKELINVTIDHIIDSENYQFKLFFDEKWNSLNKSVSPGHDIEGSWLLFEAAEVLGDEELIEKSKNIAVKMAQKVFEKGVDRKFGGIYAEMHDDGTIKPVKEWWPQAEGMVGFLNAYELSGNEAFFKESHDIWKYTDSHFIDKKYGEWFNETSMEGRVDEKMLKVDAWKCSYHNGRACFEVAARLEKLQSK